MLKWNSYKIKFTENYMKQPKLLRSDSMFKNVFAFYGTLNDELILTNVAGSILDSVETDAELLIGQHFAELNFWQTNSLNVVNLKNSLQAAVEKGFARTSLSFKINPKKFRYFELNVSVNTDQNNLFKDIFFCAFDVTKRVREVEFYKERSEHFLYAADNAEIGLWFWDLKSREIFSTPRFNEFFGLSPHDIFNYDRFLKVLHPEDVAEVEQKIEESQTNDSTYKVEYRVIHPDGNIQWISARGRTIFDKNNQPITMMGSVRGITDEKIAADELSNIYLLEKKAREEAIQANKAKDYFLALVSHELRSPLNSILGWTQILLKKKVDKETTDKAIQTIERSARSQAKLIEDLVDSARVTSGKLKLELSPVNLFEVVKQAVSSQLPAAQTKNIELAFNYDKEIIEVFGDLLRLQQIFINLISNSIKFTPDNGAVSVHVVTDEKEVFITIEDNGQGISAEDLPFIFNRFAQAEGSTKREETGLGLGLSIARILTEKQKGSIEVKSEGIGQGAEFTIKFPLHFGEIDIDDEEYVNDENYSGEGLLNNISILVVEDDEDSRNVLEIYLEQIGAKVITAESANAAVNILNSPETAFDIIISDLAMPEEDGYSLMEKVRNSTKHAKTPSIALSAFTAQANRTKAYESGFQKYHTKPFEPDLLVEEIIELVKQK